MRTIAIINQKGGCGKTTTAINLAAALARQGRRTLLVDMDPQSHCAAGLGIPEQRIEMDIGDAMLTVGTPTRPIDPAKLLWRAVRNLDVAPSRMRLAGLEAPRGGLADLPDKDKRLAAVLKHFANDYEVCCIDCPPSIGLLTYNALAAADTVLVPVETSFFSVQGANRQLQTVRTISRRLGVSLPVWLLATIHDQGNAVSMDLLEELHRRFKDMALPLVIRRDAALREAASFGQSIHDYAPGSGGAEDYHRLAVWVADNLKPRCALAAPGTLANGTLADDGTGEAEDAYQPQRAAPIPVAAAAVPTPSPLTGSPEIKPVSRAEDVARRAQEFLRRVAHGRTAAGAPTAPFTVPDSGGWGGTSPATAVATTVTPTATPHQAGVLRLVQTAIPTPSPMTGPTNRLLGVRETHQGVLFVQPLTLGNKLAIAASFNDWTPETHTFQANPALGIWELCVRLPTGKHHYRLVIDGQWCTDPYNDACEPNPFGETNSTITVTSPSAV